MASYKTSQSQASLWRTLEMSFSSSLLVLQSLLLLQLFWDTLLGPKDTDTSLELLLFFVRAECAEQRKNHHPQNLSCAPGVSLPNMGYIWNPNMPKPFRYQPRTYNQHAICWLPCGQIIADTCCSSSKQRPSYLILANCCCIKVFVALRTNSFRCCDGQLFANLNCRVAKCANWFTTPFYDCCQANVLQPQLQRSKMCKWCANSFHSETKSLQPQFAE